MAETDWTFLEEQSGRTLQFLRDAVERAVENRLEQVQSDAEEEVAAHYGIDPDDLGDMIAENLF